MSAEQIPRPIEEIPEHSTTLYFSNLHTSEYLDSFLEQAPSETTFSFSSLSRSKRPLLEGIIDHNIAHDGREATAYTAHGSIEQLTGNQGTIFTLDLNASPETNRPSQGARIIARPDGLITVYDTRSDFSYLISPHDFIDFSLRAASLYPSKARRIMKFLQSENVTENIETFYPFWLELAEKSGGQTEMTQIADHCIEQNNTTDRRIRIGRKESEHPAFSMIDLSIEHGLQRLDTDHEIITRLDLSYVSTAQDDSHAERRIFEACLPPELQLTRAQFFTNNNEVISVTKLDALDPELLQQFRAVTELAFESTAAHP